MFKSMISKKRSILTSWLISYFIVLLIPIIINTVVFFNTVRTVENEVSLSNIALLNQLQRMMDDQINQAENLCLQINWNTKIKDLINVEGKLLDSDNYSIVKIINDFKAFKMNSFFDSFYIYFKNSNTILGDTFSGDVNLTYEIIHKNDNITYDLWNKMIKGNHSLELIPLLRKDFNDKLENIIIFAQTLPMENPREIKANIFITLNPKPIYEFIDSINWIENGEIVILDKNNNTLFSSSSPGVKSLQDNEQPLPDGISYIQLNGRKVAISCVTSSNTGLKYVSILPVSIFTEKVDYVWKLTLISTLLCLLLGGIVSLLFSKKEYSTIRRLVALIAGKVGINKNVKQNEYQFIQDTISSVFNEKEMAHRKLKQQDIILRHNFLNRFLKGRLENFNFPDELLLSMDIDFKSDIFLVLLLCIDDYDTALLNRDMNCSSDNNVKTKLMQSITTVAEEFITRKHQVYIVEIDDMITCLVNFSVLVEESYKKDMRNIVAEMKQILQEKFRIALTVSVSSVCRGLNSVPKAYQESLDAMEYKIVLGKGEIIDYDEIKELKSNEYNYFYPLNAEVHLINCVKTGDFKTVEEIIFNIFDNNLLRDTNSIQIVKCLMFDFICTIIKTINELENICDKSFLNSLNPVERLLGCETIKEMKFQITDILKLICNSIEMKKKSHNGELKSNIIKYMEECYSDQNLNISSISERFNINPSYLSRFFKEQTGEYVLDFLNRIRLDNAKRLMREQKMSIIETASAVGYNNSNTFIRIFKKYEGITPGNYRA